ncbi:hypothetical protein [Nocardia huaxiensis]|uniref:Uncharacterized protein n=1 Tax=Nocardia huaxiensis TaxID=2755382 RepID=A0A7D6ZEX5_9NOCA|nr:hypothetical protein [Nocardia huaxiensis]QLY28300.1 hypothetical protein H0264_23285 [Nocardia huaxiensis]UFS98260.1 hypothetical protein LPY97_10355 [Nocardia huaxiensis]
MNWINDYCEDSYVDGVRRAQGIVKLHATCTPPCPRIRGAAEYLEQMSTETHAGRPETQ